MAGSDLQPAEVEQNIALLARLEALYATGCQAGGHRIAPLSVSLRRKWPMQARRFSTHTPLQDSGRFFCEQA